MRDGPAKILVSPFGRNHCDISFFSAGHPIFFNFCIALQNPCPGTVIKAEIKISGCIVNSSKMFKAQLPQIPPEIQQIILPNKELSVVDFLKFCLPAATQSFNGSFAPSQKLLSSLTPTITTIEEIQAIPTPPRIICVTINSQSPCPRIHNRTITYVDTFLLGASLSSTPTQEEVVRHGREPWGICAKQKAD